jgi:hypothetical protein
MTSASPHRLKELPPFGEPAKATIVIRPATSSKCALKRAKRCAQMAGIEIEETTILPDGSLQVHGANLIVGRLLS